MDNNILLDFINIKIEESQEKYQFSDDVSKMALADLLFDIHCLINNKKSLEDINKYLELYKIKLFENCENRKRINNINWFKEKLTYQYIQEYLDKIKK